MRVCHLNLSQFFFKSAAAQSLGCGGPCCAAPCSRVRRRCVGAAVCDGWSGTCGASGVALLPCAGSSAVRHRRRTRRCTTKRLVRRACDGAHARSTRWFGFFRGRLRWSIWRRRRGRRIPRPSPVRLQRLRQPVATHPGTARQVCSHRSSRSAFDTLQEIIELHDLQEKIADRRADTVLVCALQLGVIRWRKRGQISKKQR